MYEFRHKFAIIKYLQIPYESAGIKILDLSPMNKDAKPIEMYIPRNVRPM